MARKSKKIKLGRTPKRKVTGKLPLNKEAQDLFCVLYTSNSSRRFWYNAGACYAMAYGYQDELDRLDVEIAKNYSNNRARAAKKKVELNCRTSGSRLLANPDIKKRCAHLLDSFIKYEIVDRENIKVILQDHDLNAKMRGIEVYKKERGHFVDAETKATAKPQKMEITYKWKDPLPRPADAKKPFNPKQK